jgi:transcriptional regulator GlxA family with amidase domain
VRRSVIREISPLPKPRALLGAAGGSETPPGPFSTARTIVITGGDLTRTLEIGAIREVFRQADRLARTPAYIVHVVSGEQLGQYTHQPIGSNGSEAVHALTDTLIITGFENAQSHSFNATSLQWLRDQCPRIRRVVAIAGGTLILAATGLLDGRRAVTHWSLHDHLRLRYPRVLLQPNILYTRDQNLYTCAGGIASADLALSLLEEDLGSNIAAEVASRLLLHFRRTGTSRQVSLTLQAQANTTDHIFDLIAWLPDHLKEDLSVRSLARRVAMSPRNFARLFRHQVRITPAKYVEGLRFEAAQRELAANGQTISGAAELVGFTNTDALRRLFARRLGVTPGRFRGKAFDGPDHCGVNCLIAASNSERSKACRA